MSDKVINDILTKKYNIKKRGTTQTPTDTTKNLIINDLKSTGRLRNSNEFAGGGNLYEEGGMNFMNLGTSAIQGGMQLGSLVNKNLDTSGIGSEVVGTNDMSRNDILNTNVSVDKKQTSVGGGFAEGAMAGMVGLDPALLAATGGLSALIPVATGLTGGITSIFGNKSKENAAVRAEQQ